MPFALNFFGTEMEAKKTLLGAPTVFLEHKLKRKHHLMPQRVFWSETFSQKNRYLVLQLFLGIGISLNKKFTTLCTIFWDMSLNNKKSVPLYKLKVTTVTRRRVIKLKPTTLKPKLTAFQIKTGPFEANIDHFQARSNHCYPALGTKAKGTIYKLKVTTVTRRRVIKLKPTTLKPKLTAFQIKTGPFEANIDHFQARSNHCYPALGTKAKGTIYKLKVTTVTRRRVIKLKPTTLKPKLTAFQIKTGPFEANIDHFQARSSHCYPALGTKAKGTIYKLKVTTVTRRRVIKLKPTTLKPKLTAFQIKTGPF